MLDTNWVYEWLLSLMPNGSIVSALWRLHLFQSTYYPHSFGSDETVSLLKLTQRHSASALVTKTVDSSQSELVGFIVHNVVQLPHLRTVLYLL